jgi:hypothetical protein
MIADLKRRSGVLDRHRTMRNVEGREVEARTAMRSSMVVRQVSQLRLKRTGEGRNVSRRCD